MNKKCSNMKKFLLLLTPFFLFACSNADMYDSEGVSMSKKSNMNIHKTLISILLVSTVFCSCTKDDEYSPQIASTILNSLFVSIADNQGKPMNSVELLSNNEFSVVGKKTRRKAKIDVGDYEGAKMFSFSVDLPDMKSMEFKEEKTEGSGTVGLVMNIKGTKLPMLVNFSFTSSKDIAMYGGSCIRIKSIEYANKVIYPTEEMGINLIKVKYNGKNSVIEPW